MSFFSRNKKKKGAQVKKKWQLESESDSDKDNDGKEGTSLDCNGCQGESDLECTTCELYYCCTCFFEHHPVTLIKEHQAEDAPNVTDEDPESRSRHRVRSLVGVSIGKFDTMKSGWFMDQDETQHTKGCKAAVRKRKRDEEHEAATKRRKADDEEKTRQDDERRKNIAAKLAAEDAALRASLPPGIEPNSVFTLLAKSTQAEFAKLFKSGKVTASQIDDSIYKSIMDFEEKVATEIVEGFSKASLDKIRNKTGFFIGILKQYRKKGVGLVSQQIFF